MAPVISTRLTLQASLPLFRCTKSNTSTYKTNNVVCFGLKSSSSSFSSSCSSALKWKLDNKRVLANTIRCSSQGATIDLKLPRRSLLVQFTCDACGVRSQRLINRLAYEKGLVYVQCSGCSQYHKLVDNLDLVVEYDLREEINTSSDTDHA